MRKRKIGKIRISKMKIGKRKIRKRKTGKRWTRTLDAFKLHQETDSLGIY